MVSNRSRSPTREQGMTTTKFTKNDEKEVDGIFSMDSLHSFTKKHLGITADKKKTMKKKKKKSTKKEKEKSTKKKENISTKKKKEKRNKVDCEIVTEDSFSSDAVYVFNKNDFINAVPLSPSLSSSLVTTNLEEGKKEKKNKNKKSTGDDNNN